MNKQRSWYGSDGIARAFDTSLHTSPGFSSGSFVAIRAEIRGCRDLLPSWLEHMLLLINANK